MCQHSPHQHPLTSNHSACNDPWCNTTAGALSAQCQHARRLLPAHRPVPAIFLQALGVQVPPAHPGGVVVLHNEVSCGCGCGCLCWCGCNVPILTGSRCPNNTECMHQHATVKALLACGKVCTKGWGCADHVPALAGKLWKALCCLEVLFRCCCITDWVNHDAVVHRQNCARRVHDPVEVESVESPAQHQQAGQQARARPT